MSLPLRPAPPKPIPKPGQVKVVRALYQYTAQQPDELSFEEGDTLYIFDMVSDPNWWKARCKDKSGLIPSNYVEDSTEEIFYHLHEAAKRGNLYSLKECLANKVSVNGFDKAGCTPLHWASHSGNEDCFMELIKTQGIEINVQNKLGDTPLHLASWKGHSNIVKVLLEHGAKVDIINNEGKSVFDLAKDTEILAILNMYARQKLNSGKQTLETEDYGDSEESD